MNGLVFGCCIAAIAIVSLVMGFIIGRRK